MTLNKFSVIKRHQSKQQAICYPRAESKFAPSQWEMALLCNDISHWLGESLVSTLLSSEILDMFPSQFFCIINDLERLFQWSDNINQHSRHPMKLHGTKSASMAWHPGNPRWRSAVDIGRQISINNPQCVTWDSNETAVNRRENMVGGSTWHWFQKKCLKQYICQKCYWMGYCLLVWLMCSNHHCVCWWPGTKWCQAISKYSDDYKVALFFQFLSS